MLGDPLLDVRIDVVVVDCTLLSLAFVYNVVNVYVHSRNSRLQSLDHLFLCPTLAAVKFNVFVKTV